MATLKDFHPWVRLDCPGVPDPLLDDAIRNGAREFCRLSRAINADAAIVTIPGQATYVPSLPTDTEIVEVLFVKDSSRPVVLTPIPFDSLQFVPAASGDSDRFAVSETNPLSLVLYPTPDSSKTYMARFVVMPTPTAATVDDRLLSWYQEAVCAYAKYYLMSQPAKPWSNAEQAAFEFRRFNNKVSEARIRRAQLYAGVTNSITMTPFV